MKYTKTLCVGLQGRGTDIVKTYRHVDLVKQGLQDGRGKIDEFSVKYFEEASRLADQVGVTISSHQNVENLELRTNAPAETAEQYYRRNMAIPLIDHLLAEWRLYFSEQAKLKSQ